MMPQSKQTQGVSAGTRRCWCAHGTARGLVLDSDTKRRPIVLLPKCLYRRPRARLACGEARQLRGRHLQDGRGSLPIAEGNVPCVECLGEHRWKVVVLCRTANAPTSAPREPQRTRATRHRVRLLRRSGTNLDCQSDAQSMQCDHAIFGEAPTLTRLGANPSGCVGQEARGLDLVPVLTAWPAHSACSCFADSEQLRRGYARWMIDASRSFHGAYPVRRRSPRRPRASAESGSAIVSQPSRSPR